MTQHFHRIQIRSHSHSCEIQTFPKKLIIFRGKKRVLNSNVWEALISIRSTNEDSLKGTAVHNMAFAGDILEKQVSCDDWRQCFALPSIMIHTYPSPGFQKFHTT